MSTNSEPMIAELRARADVLCSVVRKEGTLGIDSLLNAGARKHGTTAGQMKYALTYAKVMGLLKIDYNEATVSAGANALVVDERTE